MCEVNKEIYAHTLEGVQDKHQWQTLQAHAVATAQLASEYAASFGLTECGYWLGLVHDLGKSLPQFQMRLEDDSIRADHKHTGGVFLWEKINNNSKPAQLAAQCLALCVISHHGGLVDCLNQFGEDNFINAVQNNQYQSNLKNSLENLRFDTELNSDVNKISNAPNLVAEIDSFFRNISVQAKKYWDNANDKRNRQKLERFRIGLMIKMLFSCLVDADHTDTASFHDEGRKNRDLPNLPKWDESRDIVERYLNTLPNISSVDAERKRISDKCVQASASQPGTYLLTVPTGGGKTLASIRFALHHAVSRESHAPVKRIIYVIPYTTIIEQNAQAVRNVFASQLDREVLNEMILESHSSVLPNEENRNNSILAENWDAQIIFTTNVQFLDAFYGAGTRNARKLHNIANSIIIFDEAQTLPVHCLHLFCHAVNFLVEHCNCTAVLCTATQPLLHEIPAENGALSLSEKSQILPDKFRMDSAESLKRVTVIDECKPQGWTHEEVADKVSIIHNQGNSCLVILNTKADARKLYTLLHKRHGEELTHHLSTAMCAAHRMDTLTEVKMLLRNKQPVICVSTQLIEAGVDIDFDTGIRALAGIDSIAQAAGRVNRNGEKPADSPLYILNISGENLNNLQDIEMAQKNAKLVLRELKESPNKFDNSLLSEAVMKRYFSYYFFRRRDEMTYKIESDNLVNLLSLNSKAISAYTRIHNDQPYPHILSQSFATAAREFKVINSDTQGILVPYNDEARGLLNQFRNTMSTEFRRYLLRRLQRYTVNIFPHMLTELKNLHALESLCDSCGIQALYESFYDHHFGVNTNSTFSPDMLIQ
ncbi:MAG: CRISPR-associated helicase Cas3' [Chlorobiaceae bacterium]|nr:CRISPR-associated helicase Cas3' [Chlorobiaceae bacterium]